MYTHDKFTRERAIGFQVELNGSSLCNREAKMVFHRYLFEYFENLSSGQSGWGMNFHDWLAMVKGWEHIECKRFVRCEPLVVEDDD